MLYFADPAARVVRSTPTLELGHGRIERRTLYTPPELNDYLAWPAVGQAGLIERTRIAKGTGELLSHERVCFVTSLTPHRASPSQLLQISRGHWTIENKSHYVRDVSFNVILSCQIWLYKNEGVTGIIITPFPFVFPG
jgi:hypothetical protein